MAKRKAKTLQLKIWLDEIEPLIWRRILVPAEMTLHELHRIVQMLFDWYDYHLYEFSIGGDRYQEPDPEAEDAPKDSTRTRLAHFDLAEGDEFTYVYDFGDHWVHRIAVERAPPNVNEGWLPFVVGGERRGPPEDCGGPDGFERLVAAIRDTEDPEHEECRIWVGGDFDPDLFDLRTVRHAVLLAYAWGGRRR
jgi:hypothetical protein